HSSGLLSLLCWEKNDRCDHRHHFNSFRCRSSAREPANLSRTRLDQQLLPASARPRAVALGNSSFSARRGYNSHLRDGSARDRKSARSTPAIRRERLRESKLGVAPHGRQRISRARLHYLSPAPF